MEFVTITLTVTVTYWSLAVTVTFNNKSPIVGADLRVRPWPVIRIRYGERDEQGLPLWHLFQLIHFHGCGTDLRGLIGGLFIDRRGRPGSGFGSLVCRRLGREGVAGGDMFGREAGGPDLVPRLQAGVGAGELRADL